MSVFKPIAKRIATTAWMQDAMNNGDALHLFREKPAMQVYAGIGLILTSYVIGWPAVAILGLLAFYTGEPLTLAIVFQAVPVVVPFPVSSVAEQST